jgi:indoleamine 2,3-dioxygenase
MDWQLRDRGFLPTPDPLTRLEGAAFEPIEQFAADLPALVYSRRFRDALAGRLREPIDWRALDGGGPRTERLFMLYSYFASAYVHAPGLAPIGRLPREIAVPLVRLAEMCGRPPILSYASYCLHNWRRVDPAGPIALGNIRLLQNFSPPGEGKEDEDWFILVHVDIEARAGSALRALAETKRVLAENDAAALERLLTAVAGSLAEMNRTMARMPEGCRPEVYFLKVRPYIFGFDRVVYEGCFGEAPQSFRGETGAQSSIVPALLAALGVRHRDSLLTSHLEDMRKYMPPPHRQFILDHPSVREFVTQQRAHGGERLADLYNSCLGELIAFRTRHFEYAVNYIEKKVDNPLATGGTPYIPWLRQLIEETKTYLL